jgi:APA family basic amino acid/polyamine antiporter
MPLRKFGQLQRAFGIAFGLAITVGGTIGVGILRRPGTIAELLPEQWAIYAIWAAGGLYSLLGALCIAELSTMLPRAGGFFVFTHRAFGPAAGFATGWCDWLSNTAAVGYASIASAELLARFSPRLQPWITVMAIALVVVLAASQCRGVRSSDHIQRVLSALLCLAFLALLVASFLQPSAHAATLPHTSMILGSWVLAFRAVIVSYDGWYEPAYFAGETTNPSRTLPRALLGGVLLVTTIYLLVNAALLHVLSVRGLRGSELPVADLARRIAGGWGDSFIVVLSLLAMVPVANASVLGAARILYGIGRELLGWEAATQVNSGGSPWVATVITAGAALLMIASGTFDALLGMASIFMVVLYCSAYTSVMVLRHREPDAERPFRTPLYPWVPVLLLVTGVAFLATVGASDSRNTIAAVGAIAVSYPVYRVGKAVLKT